jgi:catechol 2,3-dioxygenase-like lactoylglutathione lyase family enzyme
LTREFGVLSEYPIDVVFLATELDASKDFYANTMGLPVDNEGVVH